MPFRWPSISTRHVDRWALALGVAIRFAAFPFAENFWGDAPVRSEIASRWAAHPGILWSFANVFQFGPLPLNLGGIAVKLGLGADTGPRLLCLAFGCASLWLVMELAGRIGGDSAAKAAGYALALSPSHIDASTTFTSESMYLVFVFAGLIATIDRRYRAAGIVFALAAITRYDAWLWLPFWALVVMWRESAKPNANAWVGIAIACVGPLTIVVANGWASGHPLAPLSYIAQDHAALAAATAEKFGPIVWRIATVLFWPVGLIAALTIGFGGWLLGSIPRWKWWTTESLFILIAALVPPLIYAVQAMAAGTFWPMLRLALPTSALLLCFLPDARQRTLAICVAISIVTSGVAQALCEVQGPVGEVTSRIAPIPRIPADLRAGVVAAKAQVSQVLIDDGPAWEDIVISYHSGVDRFEARNRADKSPPDRIIAIRGGKLDGELRGDSTAVHGRYKKTGEAGRISWWDRVEPTLR